MMQTTLKLLIPAKKGVLKRISSSVADSGGKVERSHVRREMRGMSAIEVSISYVQPSLFPSLLNALGRIAGVALLGPVDGEATKVPGQEGSGTTEAQKN